MIVFPMMCTDTGGMSMLVYKNVACTHYSSVLNVSLTNLHRGYVLSNILCMQLKFELFARLLCILQV